MSRSLLPCSLASDSFYYATAVTRFHILLRLGRQQQATPMCSNWCSYVYFRPQP